MQTMKTDSEARREARRVLRQDRMRCRDEKYAGRAGPPDVLEAAEALEAVLQSEAARERGWSVVAARGSDSSWDMVGRDEHLHSPRSCRPPCTARTRALCTVS